MTSEKFSLKWNDFAENVSNSFSQLRQKTSLYDVTLVSNDYQQVSAHKLVLSACSEVFSNIFNSNNSPNMMLYLDSVDVKEINFMLNYIYQGEVQIYQDHLDRFLEIAAKFKLSGLLSDVREEEEVNETHYGRVSDVRSEKVQETYYEIIENDFNYHESNFEDEKRKKYVKERSMKSIYQNFEANNAAIDQYTG